MDNAVTKGGVLIRIKSVMGQLTTGHPTDCVDEVSMVEIFKPVLIWVVGVQTMIEIMSRGILNSVLITGILWNGQNMWNIDYKGLTRYSSSLNMKGVMALPALVWLLA